MIPTVLFWRFKIEVNSNPNVENLCLYAKIGLASGVKIDEFPEFYSSTSNNYAIGDLLDYKDSIYLLDEPSGNIYYPNKSFTDLKRWERFSVFKWVNLDETTDYPITTTIYDIILPSTNTLLSILNQDRHIYNFKTFNEFEQHMEQDNTLALLYTMVRKVEVTPLDTLVTVSTADNRKRIVKLYIDNI